MKYFVALLFVGFANAGLLSPVTTQYHAQDELGQYAYGYAGGPSAKEEIRTADGITRGGYSYLDAHGLVQSAKYVSDPHNGFRVAATNLPIGPAVPTGDVVSTVAAVHAAPVVAPVAARILSTPAIHSPLLSGIHLLKKRSIAAVPYVSGHSWWAPSAAAYGGYDTPAVTSAKIAHAQYHVAQRAAVASEAVANGHGVVLGHGIVGHPLLAHHLLKRSIPAVPLVSAHSWWAPSAAAYGGYDTPEVTSAKIAHAQYHVAQRNAVASEAVANGHGVVLGHGIVGHPLLAHHLLKKRSIAAVPLVSAHSWWAPSAAAYGGYDTPEVTSAKIAHAHAHAAQRATLAAHAVGNHGVLLGHGLLGHAHLLKKRSIAAAVPLVGGHGLWGAHWAPTAAAYGGYDTPAVTSAKIAHAHAHAAQRATLAATAAGQYLGLAHHGVYLH